MLSEQEETINKYKTRLRELGENVASDVEDDENDDDITWPSRASKHVWVNHSDNEKIIFM